MPEFCNDFHSGLGWAAIDFQIWPWPCVVQKPLQLFRVTSLFTCQILLEVQQKQFLIWDKPACRFLFISEHRYSVYFGWNQFGLLHFPQAPPVIIIRQTAVLLERHEPNLPPPRADWPHLNLSECWLVLVLRRFSKRFSTRWRPVQPLEWYRMWTHEIRTLSHQARRNTSANPRLSTFTGQAIHLNCYPDNNKIIKNKSAKYYCLPLVGWQVFILGPDLVLNMLVSLTAMGGLAVGMLRAEFTATWAILRTPGPSGVPGNYCTD